MRPHEQAQLAAGLAARPSKTHDVWVLLNKLVASLAEPPAAAALITDHLAVAASAASAPHMDHGTLSAAAPAVESALSGLLSSLALPSALFERAEQLPSRLLEGRADAPLWRLLASLLTRAPTEPELRRAAAPPASLPPPGAAALDAGLPMSQAAMSPRSEPPNHQAARLKLMLSVLDTAHAAHKTVFATPHSMAAPAAAAAGFVTAAWRDLPVAGTLEAVEKLQRLARESAPPRLAGAGTRVLAAADPLPEVLGSGEDAERAVRPLATLAAQLRAAVLVEPLQHCAQRLRVSGEGG
jgi:hypothetical protein